MKKILQFLNSLFRTVILQPSKILERRKTHYVGLLSTIFFGTILLNILLLGLFTTQAIGQLITWTIVDSMSNSYGMTMGTAKPLSFDAASSSLAIIHRGHPSYGSTDLWYNVSSNLGITWTRVSRFFVSGANFPTGTIFNFMQSPNPNDAVYIFAAPQLNQSGSSYGYIAYGLDQLGAGSTFAIEDPVNGNIATRISIWSAGNKVKWAARRTSPADYYLWRTTDFVTLNSGVPQPWADSNFIVNGFNINGAHRNGISYFGVWAKWPNEPGEVFNIGYSKSLDGGDNWSQWLRPQPDWRSVPGIAGSIYKDWWDFGGAAIYSFDMSVDANNRVHFFGVATDSSENCRAVVEIYETDTGWDSKFITTNLKPNTNLTYGDINPLGNNLNVITSPDGSVLALLWIDGPTLTDTLPDIWFSYRHINSNNWSIPENLTQTPGYAELLLYGAPVMKRNSATSYTVFLVRNYEANTTSYPPSAINSTHIFYTSYTFTLTTSINEPNESILGYVLEQNYPNPFNPKTNIRYQLHRDSYVSLKVYDLLGNEVAVLVDARQEAGYKSIEFDGSRLPSGIYFYRINIQNKNSHYLDVKKMALIR